MGMKPQKIIVTTGTVTYAIKGRDVLRRKGITAKIERKNSLSGGAGCGYTVVANGDRQQILEILKEAGVKILKTDEVQ